MTIYKFAKTSLPKKIVVISASKKAQYTTYNDAEGGGKG